ncbi:flagellar hook assembly protein FlgD [Paraburkholderia jirisanensis]
MTSSNTTIGNNGSNTSALMNDSMSPNKTSGTSAADLQQTFLRLLVTQLQNQDPTSPMDSSQMTSQLAQINTVSGIAQLNTSLQSLSSQLNASETGQASGLIGHAVLTPGNTFRVDFLNNADGTQSDKEGTSPFGAKLAVDSTDLKFQVRDDTGRVVSTIDMGKQAAGVVPLTSWPPADDAGNPLPAGNYAFTVTDVGADPSATAPVALTGLAVSGVVQQQDGTTGLLLNNGTTVPLNGGVSALF